MFIRSTYFPRYILQTGEINRVAIEAVQNSIDEIGEPDKYCLYVHMQGDGKFTPMTYQSEPIVEDPETIMRTFTDELNGVKYKVAEPKREWVKVKIVSIPDHDPIAEWNIYDTADGAFVRDFGCGIEGPFTVAILKADV